MTEEQIEAIVTKRFNAEMARVRRRRILILLISAAFIPMALWAATVIPNIFNDGDTLRAGQLNDNFQALAKRIDSTTGKTLQVICEKDFTAPLTSYSFDSSSNSPLNGDIDIEYQLILRIINGSGSGTTYYLQPNGDSTTSKYGLQHVVGSGTTPSASQFLSFPGMQIMNMASAPTLSAEIYFMTARSGAERILIGMGGAEQVNGTGIGYSILRQNVWNDTVSNITSLLFVATQTNGIDAGSHIEIWARR